MIYAIVNDLIEFVLDKLNFLKERGKLKEESSSDIDKDMTDKSINFSGIYGRPTSDIENDIIKKGRLVLSQIESYNKLISSEKIKKRISRMKKLVETIFKRAEQNQKSFSNDVKRIVNVYLPEILKLLKIYADADLQPIEGSNMKETKKEIHDFLDTFNESLELILNDMFKDTLWDALVSIEALNIVLKQNSNKI